MTPDSRIWSTVLYCCFYSADVHFTCDGFLGYLQFFTFIKSGDGQLCVCVCVFWAFISIWINCHKGNCRDRKPCKMLRFWVDIFKLPLRKVMQIHLPIGPAVNGGKKSVSIFLCLYVFLKPLSLRFLSWSFLIFFLELRNVCSRAQRLEESFFSPPQHHRHHDHIISFWT